MAAALAPRLVWVVYEAQRLAHIAANTPATVPPGKQDEPPAIAKTATEPPPGPPVGVPRHTFDGLSVPRQMLSFKTHLPRSAKAALGFAFQDPAFAAVLVREFVLVPDGTHVLGERLEFAKDTLDTESLVLASGNLVALDTRAQRLLEDVTQWMSDVTRPMFTKYLNGSQALAWREELTTLIHAYVSRSAPTTEMLPGLLRALFANQGAMRNFAWAMTVDAMFKADASRALMGPTSPYTVGWLNKQMLRFTLSRWIDAYLHEAASGATI